MLTSNQLEIFLTNIQDFILTRGIFYSPETYEGLEEFSNNLGETIIGKMLIPQETINKFWEYNFKNEQKKVLWKQLEHDIIAEFYGELHHPPLSRPPIIKRLRLGYHLPCRHDMKAHLFQCCKTPQEFEDYLKNFTRLYDEFEEYFRRRKERGKKFELLVWNSLECCLNDARRAGNFDLRYQEYEPAIKAWEQRNGASFYGDWNWEDLLGKEVSLEEARPPKSENNEENRQKTSPNSSPSQYYLPTNSQDHFFQTNTIPKTILPAKGAVDKPVKSNLKESNSNVHRNSLFPTERIMLFLLISLVLIILKLNIKRKKE